MIGLKRTNKATSTVDRYIMTDLVSIYIKFQEKFIVFVGTMQVDKLLKGSG